MTAAYSPLNVLLDPQQMAVEPLDNIWLSASAGTGKTQVLTARVIRLLLEDNVDPQNILCITFTKAGAAEMAERINTRLASWVQLENTQIYADLAAIGAKSDPAARQKASRLFAKLLDAPGGGLQIMTIHSLCQSLLASFPEEAGLVPGFKPVEGREQDALHREALTSMILASEAAGDYWIVRHLQSMALNMGEDAALLFLKRCASQPGAMQMIPNDLSGAEIFARRIVGIDVQGSLADFRRNACSDTAIDRISIEQFALMNAEWNTKTGLAKADFIRSWLMLDIAARADSLDKLLSCWTTGAGDQKKEGPKTEAYAAVAQDLYHWGRNLKEQITLLDYAARLAGALLAGKAFAGQYAKSKSERGLLDFDDMIRKTADMLSSGAMAQWIRYKLDSQIDHILVDEAQDTNAAQWSIIKSLSDDFFSGSGASGDRRRTIFAVGDYKQAIFGFQGTDPQQFEQAGEEFAEKIEQTGETMQQLTLSQSFRSTKPILDFVNAVVAIKSPAGFGINGEIAEHFGAKPDCGMIELFKPVTPPVMDSNTNGDTSDHNEENWLTKEKAILAHRIAAYVKRLIDEKPVLACTGKPLVPGDIMILLRRRSDLAASLVGRLHALKVAVSGIDRLKLVEPIAVKDLMAVVRFVLQPGDDLSLACMLVSPLFGWSQDKLLQYGYREPSVSLWAQIRGQAELLDDVDALRIILASADYTTPYQFLETILSGPLQGRKKMVGRLGTETLVPIEELLNAALQFEQNRGGTLQAFLAWFESGDSEVTRETISGSDEVRILTVHGSKGLQAPVVILADVTGDPDKKPSGSSELMIEDGIRLPLLNIRKSEKLRRLAGVVELEKLRDEQEHARLMYVAITRAEERLVMAGALGPQSRGVAARDSWYSAMLAAMEAMGCDWEDELPWNGVMRLTGSATPIAAKEKTQSAAPYQAATAPAWLTAAAPEESRPPRPLVPSQIGNEDYGDAPAPAAMKMAAEKGKLIHALFERINGDNFSHWAEHAQLWLARVNNNPAIPNVDIIHAVEHVVANPEWRSFFGTNARAEVPLAAVVGETVITGRVDRLVIEPGLIKVLDFKTSRNVPASPSAVPDTIMRQMAHYVAALELIFPGSDVQAALLYTHAPAMLTLSAADLAPYNPGS
jgi:ATP-dependent helicase/nuclease subunit A